MKKNIQKMTFGLFLFGIGAFAFLPTNNAQGGGIYPSHTIHDKKTGEYITFCPSADPNGACFVQF